MKRLELEGTVLDTFKNLDQYQKAYFVNMMIEMLSEESLFHVKKKMEHLTEKVGV